MLKIKLSLLILLFSMTATFSAPQQQTEAASKVLALERSEVVYDWRANAFIANFPITRQLDCFRLHSSNGVFCK